MTTSVPSSSTSPKATKVTAVTKKARLIFKDLDRSPSRTSPRSGVVKTKLKTYAKQPSNKTSREKLHVKPRMKFRRGPSNYEANLKTTHSLASKRTCKTLKLQELMPLRNTRYNKLPFASDRLEVEHEVPVVRRTLLHQYHPSRTVNSTSRTQRTQQLRLLATYSPARYLLAGMPRLRANSQLSLWAARTSMPLNYTGKKRSAILYMFDARKLGRRSRRKSKPRVSLTAARAKLARQLVRKFRASRGVKHSAVRRRLIRFRWFNRKFLKKLKYPFRKRVLRRSVRRAFRYLHSTTTVLAGAAQRHQRSRRYHRVQRLVTRRTENASSQLLLSRPGKLANRQRLFTRQQLSRKAQATRLLEVKNRLLSSMYRIKSNRTHAQARRAAQHLERKLLTQRADRAAPRREAYRTFRLLQRSTAVRTARWLELRSARVQKKALFDKKYLTTPFVKLQQFSTRRRVRRIAYQHQQPQVAYKEEPFQIYPEPTNTRYSELRRRLQLKARLPERAAPDSLAEVSAFMRSDELTLWRSAAVGIPVDRFQLPDFARNRVLRSRAAALYLRVQAVSHSAATAANRTLSLQQSRMLEKRFYRQRPALRLPRTSVKRSEIRRGGARLFARNTLKTPETWAGKRKLLLPVLKSYSLGSKHSATDTQELTDLRHTRRALSAYPKVWARGPGYHESALVYDIRDKKRNATVRTSLRRAKLRSKKVSMPSATKAATAANKIHGTIPATTAIASSAGTVCSTTTKLTLLQERVLRAVRYNLRRSSGQASTVTLGSSIGRTTLRCNVASSRIKKQRALWHLRSVQKMLASERSLSAWSPQYPTRWRRWSSPRFEGSPSARRWPSRKLLRQRAMINAALVYRGKPKRKHFDKAYSHLQYHRGSAATVGYERFRRVQRMRSKNNRWWKPTTCPSPFSSPYSRRSINARNNITRRLARKHTANLGEVGTRARSIKGAWFPVAQPPRTISSLNLKSKPRRFERPKAFKLREKAERTKLPATLQRWTVRAEKYRLGTTSSPRKVVTLARNRRTLRRLEGLYPRLTTWSARSWQNLDTTHKNASSATLYSAACHQLPTSFWNNLHQTYPTVAAATVARRAVFNKFSAWYAQLPAATTEQHSHNLLLTAVNYIISAADALSRAHQQLETSQYARAVTRKKDRFWRLRELPRLQRGLQKGAAILHKSNTSLYKHWLRGAERYLKKNQASYLPPKHRRGGSGVITSFGRNRQRFPASGRRRHSYDATLHAFARRSTPAVFRRVSNLRFKRLTGEARATCKGSVHLYELSPRLRRQRALARRLARVAYLSSTWRELVTYRAVSPLTVVTEESTAQAQSYAQPFGSGVKRRFALLPTTLLFKRAAAARQASRVKNAVTLRTQRAGLLRTALRRRGQERVFIDLKKHVSRRKLPKEELSAPWRLKRSAKRKEQHQRYGDWSPRHFQLQQSKALFWALYDLEDRVPRRRDRARVVLTKSACSEVFALPQMPARKLAWVKNGFQIKPPALKAHRRVRRDKKRRRRGRSGITKERRARFHHTSERRNFSALKKISGRSNKNLLKKLNAGARKFTLVSLGRTPGRLLPQKHWQLPAQKARFALIQKPAALSTKKRITTSDTPLASTSLQPYSSENRSKKLLQLILRADVSKNKFMKRTVIACHRVTKHLAMVEDTTKLIQVQAAQALHKFTVDAIAPSRLTPLVFQRPTKLVVKSDAEKKRAVVWNIQSKERRYKRTAQYAEALTGYIPQLISCMLSHRSKKTNLSHEQARTLINATYWNLRVYLNVDPFERRLALRDSNFSFLQMLAQNIAAASKEQATEHVERTQLRKRFQSCRIHPAPTSDRFRLDWLRAFFPRKHALFQEDPEEYATIPVSTRNIRRLIPSGYGISRWRTAPASISIERRSRQLLRLRLSRCTPRFENLLQSTRRIPLTEVDSLLPEMDSINPAASPSLPKRFLKNQSHTAGFLLTPQTLTQSGLSNCNNSFFCRQFTTQAIRTAGAVSSYISRRSRLLTSSQTAISPFVAIVSRYQLKNRVEARGRSSFTANSRWTIDTGSLDPRFLRFKSPRSRQYLIRLPEEIVRRSEQEKLTKFLAIRDLCANYESVGVKKALSARRRVRMNRRYFYNNSDCTSCTEALIGARANTTARRSPTLLLSRSIGASQELSATEVYNFPNRKQRVFIPSSVRKQHRRVRANLVPTESNRIIAGARSILQYRTARRRTTIRTYAADRTLRQIPFTLRSEPKRAGRAGKNTAVLLAKLVCKRDSYLQVLRFASGSKRGSYLALFTRAQRTLLRAQNRLTVIRTMQTYVPATVGKSAQPVALRAQQAVVQKPVTVASSTFTDRLFHSLAVRRRFTKKCMRLQATKKRMTFDTSRPRLWHKLTHRWMKKERLMRNWLKGVKRWFRDPWLSKTVDISRPASHRLLPGEIRAREQQVGEVVVGDENAGFTEEEGLSLQKAALPAIAAAQKVVKADSRLAYQLSKRVGALQKKVIRVRRAASQEALRTPRPSMWLADLQAKKRTAETALWRTKTRKEKDEVRLAEKEVAIARAKSGLPPLAKKKDPLKMPADHWMPSIIWKDIQRRARRLEWRESDDAFVHKGFRNAFRFYPSERNRVPWLESLMYNRSLFSTRLREFRRYQFPKDQKKYKWLQRVRKSLFPGRTHTYIKGRRWPRLRMYNQRLHYTLFNLSNGGAARRHFKKLNRRSRKVGFVHSQAGLSNRLDNVLIHLNIAPTIFWARVVAPHGLLRVNGAIVTEADYLFKAGDFIEPIWAKITRFRHFFECPLNRNEGVKRRLRFSVGGVPRNLHFHRSIRCFTFLGNPRESDLRGSSRLQPHLFRWFRLDAV